MTSALGREVCRHKEFSLAISSSCCCILCTQRCSFADWQLQLDRRGRRHGQSRRQTGHTSVPTSVLGPKTTQKKGRVPSRIEQHHEISCNRVPFLQTEDHHHVLDPQQVVELRFAEGLWLVNESCHPPCA